VVFCSKICATVRTPYLCTVRAETTPISGLLVLHPRVFEDERGHFFESYNRDVLAELGIAETFVQDNQSLSQKGVLRGLHFQAPPFAQGKLVRVVTGRVYDVALDIRVGSPTYGQHYGIELSGANKTQFWIPPGFAHGFVTLEDHTLFAYKCTAGYSKISEGSVRWNDPQLGIDWGLEQTLLSEKDQLAPLFHELKSPFTFEP